MKYLVSTIDDRPHRDAHGNGEEHMPSDVFHSRNDFDALHGGKDADGRGDDTVPDEEGDADEGKNADKGRCPPGLEQGEENRLCKEFFAFFLAVPLLVDLYSLC